MLIQFRVRNFRSLHQEQRLSFVAQKQRGGESDLIKANAAVGHLLRSVAVYGANASGKSNLMRAFNFFRDAVRNSQKRWDETGLPFAQFAGTREASETSVFAIDFLVDGVRYEYGFEAASDEISGEWLYAFPFGRKQIWFERKVDSVFSFGRFLNTGESRKLCETIAKLVRPNSLFLSAAIQNNLDALRPVYDSIVAEWIVLLGSRFQIAMTTAQHTMENPSLRERVGKLLQSADLGLIDCEVDEEVMTEAQQKVVAAMISAMSEREKPSTQELDYKVPKVAFIHQNSLGEDFRFSIANESEGTVAYFGLLGPVIRTLESGGLLVVDEIDSSIHPNLATALVSMFNDAALNTKNAQLLFSTHSTTLLSQAKLRRDQIWFVQKDNTGASSIYPLTDFHLRKGEKVEKGYLQGRFGAVPIVDTEMMKEWLSAQIGSSLTVVHE